MQQRAASYSRSPARGSSGLAIVGSLALVTLSYVLLLAQPVASRQLGNLVSGETLRALESWWPTACSLGLVLGGGAALMFVLVQVVREAALRPYVCLSPALAAFAACIMIGLRAQLPLPGVSSSHIAVFSLSVTVIGGALMQHARVSAQLLGLMFALLPPVCLLGVFWMISGLSDPADALWRLPGSVRAYLATLTGASFSIATVALLQRGEEDEAFEPMVRLPRAGLAEPMDGSELELSFARDAELLSRREIPRWAIAAASACAVLVGFLALKLALDSRSSTPTVRVEARHASEQAVAARSTEPVAAPVEPANREPAALLPKVEALAPANVEPPAQGVAAAAALVLPAVEATPADESPAAALEPTAMKSAEEAPLKPQAVRRVRSKSKVERSAKSVAPAKQEEAPAQAKLAKQAEPAPAAKEDVAGKSSTATKERVAKPVAAEKPAAADKAAAPAPTRGDESLDELMDRVTKGKGDKRASVSSGDDPIFGL